MFEGPQGRRTSRALKGQYQYNIFLCDIRGWTCWMVELEIEIREMKGFLYRPTEIHCRKSCSRAPRINLFDIEFSWRLHSMNCLIGFDFLVRSFDSSLPFSSMTESLPKTKPRQCSSPFHRYNTFPSSSGGLNKVSFLRILSKIRKFRNWTPSFRLEIFHLRSIWSV